MSGFLVALVVSLGVGAAALLAGLKAARDGAYWTGALALIAAPIVVAVLAPELAAPAGPLVEAMAPFMAEPGAGVFTDGTGPTSSKAGTFFDLPRLVFLGWLAGALGRAGFEVLRSLRLEQVMARTTPASEDVRRRLGELARRAGVAAPPVRIGAGPMTAGVFRPRIVLPAGLETEPVFDAVVTHELAHVRRADPLVLALARIGGVIFWFNPFWFAVERRRRLAAEIDCDRAALRLCETGGARPYARALLAASRADSGPQAALQFGVAPRDALKMRLIEIVSPAPKARAAGAVARLAALTVIAAPFAALQIAQASGLQAAPEFSHMILDGRTTSHYGPRHLPGLDVPRFHSGQDIAAAVGTPIRSPAAGRVV